MRSCNYPPQWDVSLVLLINHVFYKEKAAILIEEGVVGPGYGSEQLLLEVRGAETFCSQK